MKKLSLLMLVLSLLPIIGVNAYASEDIDTSNNNQEINTNENEAINQESNQGNQEGELSDNDVNNGETSSSDDNQSSIQYDDPSKATLSSTNFLINESEIPPVENICDQVEQGQACLVQLGTLDLVKKYGNVTALNEKGEPGNWEYQPKLTVLLGGQEGGVDMTINGTGTFRVGFVLEMIDSQGVSLWGDSGDVRITVVPDSVSLDQSHLAGLETKTDYVELTTTELEARMGNWNPETSVSSIKYDANKMVTDLFGAKAIGAGNPNIDSNLAFAVTNTSDLDGIVNSQIGEYKIDVSLGLTRNNQVVKTLTLVVKEPVVDVPVVENTVAPKTTNGSGVQTGSDNNIFISLLTVIVASTMLLMLRRFRKE